MGSSTTTVPLRVFLVEDSPMLRERVLESLAEVPNVQVLGFADSEPQALKGVVGLGPDVVIVDIQLKEGNGINLLRTMQGRDFRTRPTVIVLTNFGGPEYRRLCLKYGADHFFDKSSELHRVTEVLSELAPAGM